MSRLLFASVAVIDSSYAIATAFDFYRTGNSKGDLGLQHYLVPQVYKLVRTRTPRPSQCSPGDSSCGQRTSIGFSSRDGLNGDTRYESLDGARRISVSLASDCLMIRDALRGAGVDRFGPVAHLLIRL